jgi:hydroxyacylglutathione hydrolase
VALERQINPFLRSRENTVREGLRERCTHHDDVEVFAALRRWKSEFK